MAYRPRSHRGPALSMPGELAPHDRRAGGEGFQLAESRLA
jgi:hypothetical protein